MSVSRLDKSDDWTFGLQRAGYITGNNEVIQNVKTRVKSFQNDFFLDMSANINWFSILGSLNNRNVILREVERVTSQTEGVANVRDVQLTKKTSRNATITIIFDTIYNNDRLEIEATV